MRWQDAGPHLTAPRLSGAVKALRPEECVQMYVYSPSFRRETAINTGERDGRSSQIYADCGDANALLLWLDLAPAFCGG